MFVEFGNYHFKHFKATVPEQRISVGGRGVDLRWRFFDAGPRSVPPLICLGGVAATADCYYKQILALSAKGFRVIAVDAPPVWTHEKWMTAFDQFLDGLHIHQVHIYGTSLGGFLAQLYARNRPRRVLSLLLSNTFLNTELFHHAFGPWSNCFPWTPDFVLKRLILSGFREGPHEALIAEAIDFVVLRLEKLSQQELASRLVLNTQRAFIGPLHFTDSFRITIMDSLDAASVPSALKDALYNRYPNANKAFLKSGGDFPFLSRADEVNLHLFLHLRHVGAERLGPDIDTVPVSESGQFADLKARRARLLAEEARRQDSPEVGQRNVGMSEPARSTEGRRGDPFAESRGSETGNGHALAGDRGPAAAGADGSMDSPSKLWRKVREATSKGRVGDVPQDTDEVIRAADLRRYWGEMERSKSFGSPSASLSNVLSASSPSPSPQENSPKGEASSSTDRERVALNRSPLGSTAGVRKVVSPSSGATGVEASEAPPGVSSALQKRRSGTSESRKGDIVRAGTSNDAIGSLTQGGNADASDTEEGTGQDAEDDVLQSDPLGVLASVGVRRDERQGAPSKVEVGPGKKSSPMLSSSSLTDVKAGSSPSNVTGGVGTSEVGSVSGKDIVDGRERVVLRGEPDRVDDAGVGESRESSFHGTELEGDSDEHFSRMETASDAGHIVGGIEGERGGELRGDGGGGYEGEEEKGRSESTNGEEGEPQNSNRPTGGDGFRQSPDEESSSSTRRMPRVSSVSEEEGPESPRAVQAREWLLQVEGH